MEIRLAEFSDIPKINDLLLQVLEVHHKGRPDLFKGGCKKYTDEELKIIMSDNTKPIFVACDETGVLGYAFCVIIKHSDNNILTDIKTLYIDDLCVDENIRGKHVGRNLYGYVKEYAKSIGCYNVTLNVWACNEDAMKFYEKCGMIVQKIGMETIL